MLENRIVYGSVVALVLMASHAQAQGFTALPVEGAPLAQPGPYEVVSEATAGSSRYVVYRPADLNAFPLADTLPVVAWGNGGCASDSRPYAGYLTTIASHGFLVLTTRTEEGAPSGQVPPADLRGALDWAESEAARESSPLRGKIATDRMAVMGQSCGALLAISLGADPRVGTIGVFNGGAQSEAPAPLPTTDALADLHGPVLLVNGHATDHAMERSAANFQSIDHVPVFYGARRNAGHLGTVSHPGGGEFANVASRWLKWTLKGDAAAGAMFVGAECELCTNPNWETRSKKIE